MIMRERVPSKLSKGAFAALILLTMFLLPGWSLVGADKKQPATPPRTDAQSQNEPANFPTTQDNEVPEKRTPSSPIPQPQVEPTPFDLRPTLQPSAPQKNENNAGQNSPEKANPKKGEKATFSFHLGFDDRGETRLPGVVFSDFGQIEQKEPANAPVVHPASDNKRLDELEKKLDALIKVIASQQKPAANDKLPVRRANTSGAVVVYESRSDGKLKIYREGDVIFTVLPNGQTHVAAVPGGSLTIEQCERFLKTLNLGRDDSLAAPPLSPPIGAWKSPADQRQAVLKSIRDAAKAQAQSQKAQQEKTIDVQQNQSSPGFASKAGQIIQTTNGPLRLTIVKEARINERGERVIVERAIYVPIIPQRPYTPASENDSLSAPGIVPFPGYSGQNSNVSPNQGLRLSVPAIGPVPEKIVFSPGQGIVISPGPDKDTLQSHFQLPRNQIKALSDLLKMIPEENITINMSKDNPLKATTWVTITASREIQQVINPLVVLLQQGMTPAIQARILAPQDQKNPVKPKVQGRSIPPSPPKANRPKKTDGVSNTPKVIPKTTIPDNLYGGQNPYENLPNLPEKIDSFILERLNDKITPKPQDAKKSPPINAVDDPASPPIKIERR